MKTSIVCLNLVVLLAFCPALARDTDTSPLPSNLDGWTITAKPLRDSISINSVFGVEFTLKNRSPKSLWLYTWDGSCGYAKFEPKVSGVVPRPDKPMTLADATRRISRAVKEFPSGAEFTFIEYASEKWLFPKAGHFELNYSGDLAIYNDKPEMRKGGIHVSNRAPFSGTVTVEVMPTQITEQEFLPLLAMWKNERLRSGEVFEGLSYFETPLVIPHAVKLARAYPRRIGEASKLLQKFTNTPEGVRALEELGQPFPDAELFDDEDGQERKEWYAADDMNAVYYAFRIGDVQPSEKFLLTQLQSSTRDRVAQALVYMCDCEGRLMIDDKHLEHLKTHEEEWVRERVQNLLAKNPKQEKAKQDF